MPLNPVVLPATVEDKSLALKRRMLREAIDESGWKHDAVAASLGVDAPYLSKMLAGEKTITLRHLDLLPDDIEAIYSRKYAEHHGLIVVPRVSDAEADRHFAIGLFNKLTRGAA